MVQCALAKIWISSVLMVLGLMFLFAIGLQRYPMFELLLSREFSRHVLREQAACSAGERAPEPLLQLAMAQMPSPRTKDPLRTC